MNNHYSKFHKFCSWPLSYFISGDIEEAHNWEDLPCKWTFRHLQLTPVHKKWKGRSSLFTRQNILPLSHLTDIFSSLVCACVHVSKGQNNRKCHYHGHAAFFGNCDTISFQAECFFFETHALYYHTSFHQCFQKRQLTVIVENLLFEISIRIHECSFKPTLNLIQLIDTCTCQLLAGKKHAID